MSLDIVKREKIHKINKNRSQIDFLSLLYINTQFVLIQKKMYQMINYVLTLIFFLLIFHLSCKTVI